MRIGKYPQKIGRQLLIYVVFFSTFVTFLTTGFQLFTDFNSEKETLERRMGQIRDEALPSLTTSLWDLYESQAKTQLEGISQRAEIEYVEIRSKGQVFASAGRRLESNRLVFSYPMVYERGNEKIQLGEFEVMATLEGIYQGLWDRLVIILVSNAIKTFLVSLFLLLIFQFLVTRHLSAIAKFLDNFVQNGTDESLHLRREKRNDELQEVTDVINSMRGSLQETTVSRNYLDNILFSMENMLIVTDSNAIIWTVNRAILDNLDYTEDELVGLPLLDLFDQQKFSKDRTSYNYFNNIPIRNQEASIISKGGQCIPILFSCTVMPDSSELPNGMICLAQDISERKMAEYQRNKLESQLRQSQKLEALGSLASGVAHDFNNLLGAIMIGVEDLMDMHKEDSDTYATLDIVNTAVEQGSSLVQQILTFSRAETKEFQNLALSVVVSKAILILRASSPNNIEIEDQLEDQQAFIYGDSTQIQQIVINLGNNAFHAMRGKPGTLKIQLHPSASEGHLRLSISDDGTGIEHDKLDQIFDPFFTTKKIGEGTGLGLSVVYGIVKGHNGSISVESKLGVGSTFYVDFPIVE